ncbi:hypothetical protein [Azospirillum sp. TSO5]|uniref:hypothetical protein n=1 Tax=Azospirillum sp. TSO5 TaxID=716760 RepID=UPI0011B24C15|nr:hypothetical protein [Azospirillum sp. TSO5]
MIAEAWSRLEDVPNLGRSKLKPGRYARDGSRVEKSGVSRMEAYPFADSDRDYLAERLGLPEGSESVRRTREHIAAVMEVYETALGIWKASDEAGEDKDAEINGPVSGLLEIAHDSTAAALLLANLCGGWIEEEGRDRPDGEASCWDAQPDDDDEWVLGRGPSGSVGTPERIAALPKRQREVFARWDGPQDLRDAVAAATGTIRDAIRRAKESVGGPQLRKAREKTTEIWKAEKERVLKAWEEEKAKGIDLPKPKLPRRPTIPPGEEFKVIDDLHWDMLRGVLEYVGARHAFAKLLAKTRRRGPLSRFNLNGLDRDDFGQAAELVRAVLDSRKTARAVGLLTNVWKLPPMRSEDHDRDEHTPETCDLLPWPHAPEDCPEHKWSSRVVGAAQTVLDEATDNANLCIGLAKLVVYNTPNRVDDILPRLFGLSAAALRGNWGWDRQNAKPEDQSDYPDWAWKPGVGVDTEAVARRLGSAADVCHAAMTMIKKPAHTKVYSDEMARVGHLARSVVFECGLVSEEVPQPPKAKGQRKPTSRADMTAGDKEISLQIKREERAEHIAEDARRKSVIIVARGGVVPGMAMSKAYQSVSRWATNCLNEVLAEAATSAVADAIGPAGVKAVMAPFRKKGRTNSSVPIWSDHDELKRRFASVRVKIDPSEEVAAATGMPLETVRAIVEDAKARAADGLLSDPEVRAKVTEILRRTLTPLDTPPHKALALVAELCLNASQTQSGGSNYALALPANVWLMWGAIQVAEAAGLPVTDDKAPLGKDTFAWKVVDWIRGARLMDHGHAPKISGPHTIAVGKVLKSDRRPKRSVFEALRVSTSGPAP